MSTDIVFKKKLCGDQCPDNIEAVICNSPESELVYMFNALAYNLANCACKAINRSIFVVRTDEDLMRLYSLGTLCGGSNGQAWIQYASDYTRCYVLLSGEQRIVPALSCDLALPVVCH